MRALLALGLVLIALPAMAGDYPAEWNPPAKFDRPFHGETAIRKLHPKHIEPACKRLYSHYGMESPDTPGCAVLTNFGSRCYIIVIDRPFGGTTPEAVIRHEVGHCNGWPADHPE